MRRSRVPLLALLALLHAAPDSAAVPQGDVTLRGTVLSLHDSKPLLGISVELRDSGGRKVAEAFTGKDGAFLLPRCSEGRYLIRVAVEGFEEHRETLELRAAEQRDLTIALRIKGLSETVEVVSRAENKGLETISTTTSPSTGVVDLEPVKGDSFQALLPLVPGVVRGPDGRINVKGASAIQSSLLVSSSNAIDPATGNPGFELPVDAIESVQVLPNPYQAEYGRFSSGVTRIETRKGDLRWGFLINNFLPRYKWRDGHLMGVEHYTPRLSVSGPLVRDRLYWAQSFQYRLIRTPVPARPVLERDQSLESFDAFTRIDLAINNRHALVATFAVFPRKLDYITMNTFNPREVTANLHNRGLHGGFQETTIFGPTALLETAISFRTYDTDVFGQGLRPMQMYPAGNQGNFFNRQARRTGTFQWTETGTRLLAGAKGRHLIKAGIDLVRSEFQGSSSSSNVEIYRADGSLHTTIEFSAGSNQSMRTTNFGLYLQDHWRVSDRLAFEYGLRMDRDAIPSSINLAPRAGFVFSVLPQGRGIVRGGGGFFYDQTPINTGVFEEYERRTIRRFGAAGSSAVEAPVSWLYRSNSGLASPYGFIWNLEYDQHISGRWLARASYMRRRGHHEYILDPLYASGKYEYLLDSRGRSRYWETELTLRYSGRENLYMIWTYVRSRSEADLNGYDLFLGNFRNPVIQPNEFSLASIDAPHRFLHRAVLPAPFKISFSPMLEVRTGFPFSAVNEGQQFVGTRNRAGRFPLLGTLDVRVVRAFKFWKYTVEVGARVYHLLNSFTPRDVQANVDAPDYGTFYNTIPRNWGFTLQFKK